MPTRSRRSTQQQPLFAIPALVKKAKLAALERTEFTPAEMELYHQITADTNNDDDDDAPPSKLFTNLIRRRGTLTVIPEYRSTGFTIDNPAPMDAPLFSSSLRQAGVGALAVLDRSTDSATSHDLTTILEEQRRAHSQVPGPLPVISHDILLDARQIARAALQGVAAVVVDVPYHPDDASLRALLRACRSARVQAICACQSRAEIDRALAAGARWIKVDPLEEDVDAAIPDPTIGRIATLPVRNDSALTEIEDAWKLRDQGYHAVWVGEVLFKAGESPAAICKAMQSKSSVQWASPAARSGRGEGAREYLGDIMM